MGIKFSVKASDLNAALDIVSIVSPRPFDKQGTAGYLFVIRGLKGYVYSRDAQHVSRSEFVLSDVEGEGAFIYPASYINAFRAFGEHEITFSVTDGETFSVAYSCANGAKSEKSSYDPKFMQSCDKDLDGASDERTFPAAILREALSLSKAFTSDAKDTRAEEKQKTVQIFDKNFEADDPKNPGQKHKPYEKGDGYLQASNGTQLFSFYSDAFVGKSLAIHSQHLPLLQSFLAKCQGDVTLSTGANMTFARDNTGRVLGWTHHAAVLPKFASYALSSDQLVMWVDRSSVLHALKYVADEMDDRREKIKFIFDAASSSLQFQIAEGNSKTVGWPVPVRLKEDETKEKRDVQLNVNIAHFKDLFDGAKSNEIMLRLTVVPPNDKRPKESGMFRTIDEFILDATGKIVGGSGVEKKPEGSFVCKVTRFTPSML